MIAVPIKNDQSMFDLRVLQTRDDRVLSQTFVLSAKD